MKSRLDLTMSRLARLQGRIDDRLASESRRRATADLVAKLHAARARAAQGIFPEPWSEEELRERSRRLRLALGR